MLFNSYTFLLLFLPAMLLGWWVVFRRPVYRLGYLTLMSWVFYSAFQFPTGLKLLPLLILSTTVDYVAGRAIVATSDQLRRKRVLVAALVFNLSLLGIFKYLGFFGEIVNGVLGALGGGDVDVPALILPIGISFYTFNSMSYTIDIYRGRVKPARNLLEYTAFVAMFPHLIAGPIVRYSDIDTQLRSLHVKLSSRMVGIGLTFFLIGLSKKLIIADSISPTVDHLFATSGDLTVVTAWAAALGYSMQLYFDFSGYSDMAVGLAMLLGFRFPQNFDSPYKAVNASDFWRRWHMSLSRWLRDYLFIPLGGSRHGRAKTIRNLFITMFLGGLWHGAAWAYVIWGVAHGVMLAVHNVASSRGWVPRSAWVARAITFICVVILWVPFRAGAMPDSFGVTTDVIGAMFGANGLGLASLVEQVQDGSRDVARLWVEITLLLVFVNVLPNSWQIRLRPTRGRGIALGFALAACLLLLTAPSPFLYFQF